MKAEELFSRTAISYKRLLSSGSDVPSLRDYCRRLHVSYLDFLRWGSVNDIASGILEIERSKKRLQKNRDDYVQLVSGYPSVSEVPVDPLLYPLHIISDNCDPDDESVSTPSRLFGIRINFPNGVKVFVREADSHGIYSLIHGQSF